MNRLKYLSLVSAGALFIAMGAQAATPPTTETTTNGHSEQWTGYVGTIHAEIRGAAFGGQSGSKFGPVVVGGVPLTIKNLVNQSYISGATVVGNTTKLESGTLSIGDTAMITAAPLKAGHVAVTVIYDRAKLLSIDHTTMSGVTIDLPQVATLHIESTVDMTSGKTVSVPLLDQGKAVGTVFLTLDGAAS